MSKYEKLIKAMKSNPNGDWNIDDLKKLAHRVGAEYRQPGTSHVTFRFPDASKLTVPAHKPIKPVYIKMFVAKIEEQEIKDEKKE